jgi:DNA polymerase-3 subunit epsilon/oligoribonuclease
LDPFTHVPLELAFIIVDLVSGHEVASYETLLQVSEEAWSARDLTSVDINGLTRKELDKGVTRSQAGEKIESLFSTCQINNDRAFFICQNPSFDRPFFSQIIPPYRQEVFRWPYHWLDLASMYWASALVYKQTESPFGLRLSKNSIAQSLGLEPESTPHRAMNGARHLLACYERLVGFPSRC